MLTPGVIHKEQTDKEQTTEKEKEKEQTEEEGTKEAEAEVETGEQEQQQEQQQQQQQQNNANNDTIDTSPENPIDNQIEYEDYFDNATAAASTAKESKAVTTFLQLVAGSEEAKVSYAQLLRGLLFDEAIRSAWNSIPGAEAMTVRKCALLSNKKIIDSNDLSQWVALEEETTTEFETVVHPDFQQIFDLIDDNKDGVITYKELLSAIGIEEIQTFMKERPSLAPLLRPAQIKATMKTIVDGGDDDQLTLSAFVLFSTAVSNDVDVSISKNGSASLDAIDQLFALLDTNNDGILSYSECLQGMSDSRAKAIIESEDAKTLGSLLHPREMQKTMKAIAKAHPSGELNRQAFRLYIAVQSG